MRRGTPVMQAYADRLEQERLAHVNQPELFDVSRTVPTACPVGSCQAIRLAGQAGQVPTCAHDLDPESRRRPSGCLNAINPATTQIPF